MIYEFSDLTLDLDRHLLTRGEEPVKLTKLSFKALQALQKNGYNITLRNCAYNTAHVLFSCKNAIFYLFNLLNIEYNQVIIILFRFFDWSLPARNSQLPGTRQR